MLSRHPGLLQVKFESSSHLIHCLFPTKLVTFSRSLAHPRQTRKMSTNYDAIIIGSGQAGTPLAGAFAKAGHHTALIERAHIGGCCVNEGCTPTKTMVASGRVAYLARRGQDYGIRTSNSDRKGSSLEARTALENGIFVDMMKVRQRKRDIVDSFRGGNEKRTMSAGVDVLMGEAAFTGPKTLRVKMADDTEKLIEGDKIFINVGERPAPPKLDGLLSLDPSRVLDSTSIQELAIVPTHLVVIGGGYVGVEFAQLFRRLGSEVTILQRGKQLLGREDEEVAECLMRILKEDGLVVSLESEALSVVSSNSGSFDLTVKSRNNEEIIHGTHLLFAAGRIPNTDSLDLKAAGIMANKRGYIDVNEYLETSVEGVWALGDVKGPPAFTHISYDDFRIIQKNIITSASTTTKLSTKNRLVPYVVYTDPQLGHIGLHEHEARALYRDNPSRIKIAKMPMSYVARALETDESRGMMKAAVDGETGLILGFTCLGIEGGELMAVVQMAIMGNVGWERLRDAVWAHPSLAESLNNLWGFLE